MTSIKYTVMRKTKSGRGAIYQTVTKTPCGTGLRMFSTSEEALRALKYWDVDENLRVVELKITCDAHDLTCEVLRAWNKHNCLDSEFLEGIKGLHDEIIFES